jgi:hypothetical protein
MGESAKETEEKQPRVNEKPGIVLSWKKEEVIRTANASNRSPKMGTKDCSLHSVVCKSSVTWKKTAAVATPSWNAFKREGKKRNWDN